MPLSMPHLLIPDMSLITDPTLALTMMARTFSLRARRAVAGAAAPTYVAAGTGVTGSTSLSVPYYAGLAADDIALIFVCSNSSPTIGVPSNYTAISNQIADSNSSNYGRGFWKRLTGSESGNVTVSCTGGSQSEGVMIGIRGCITTGTPYEGHATTTTYTATPAITTTGPNRLLIDHFYWSTDSSSVSISGWTRDAYVETAGENATAVFHKERATAGTEAATNYSNLSALYGGSQAIAMLPTG